MSKLFEEQLGDPCVWSRVSESESINRNSRGVSGSSFMAWKDSGFPSEQAGEATEDLGQRADVINSLRRIIWTVVGRIDYAVGVVGEEGKLGKNPGKKSSDLDHYFLKEERNGQLLETFCR